MVRTGQRRTGRSKSGSSAAQWDQVATTVKEGAAELQSMTTHAELYSWAKEHELATKSLFPMFKTEILKRFDIDYVALREHSHLERLARIAELATDGPTVELWAAGDDEADSYAICGPDGAVAWYCTFHPDDPVRVEDDQTSADLSAARKAVFLAGEVRHELNLDAIRLTLHLVNHHVTAEHLIKDLIKASVCLTIDIVDESIALDWCREPGQKWWRETNLERLVANDDTDAEPDAPEAEPDPDTETTGADAENEVEDSEQAEEGDTSTENESFR